MSEELWSSELHQLLTEPIKHLWVHELLFTKASELLNFDANNDQHQHDIELLNLNIDELTHETLVHNFKCTNCFKWLETILSDEIALSFGAISKRLHDIILDDPIPYRKEIKVFVANLYTWFALLPEYEISRPRHSQIIRLKKKNN